MGAKVDAGTLPAGEPGTAPATKVDSTSLRPEAELVVIMRGFAETIDDPCDFVTATNVTTELTRHSLLKLRENNDELRDWLYQKFEELLSFYKSTHPCDNLNADGELLKCKQAVADMLKFQTDIKSWQRPLTVGLRRAEFFRLDEEIVTQVKSCNRFLQCLQDDKTNCSAARQFALKVERGDRNKVSAVLRKSDVPSPLAKAAADALQAISKLTSAQDHKEKRPQLPKLAISDKTVWCEPHWIPHNKDLWIEAGGTHWHVQLFDWYEQNKAKALELHTARVSSMIMKGLNHAHMAISPDAVGPSIDFNPQQSGAVASGDVEQIFNVAADVKTMLYAMRELHFDPRFEAWGWRHQRVLCVQLVGSCVAVILTKELAEQHQDCVSWLSSAHHAALQDCKSVLREPGDGLYLPLGAWPLFVPLPYDADKAENTLMTSRKSKKGESKTISPDEYMSLAVMPLFDYKLDVCCSSAACRLAAASYTASMNWLPNYASNVDVKTWREKVEARGASVAADS